MDKVNELITQAQAAKKAYEAQYQKVWSIGSGGQYNGRYSKKCQALWKEWKSIEDQLLKAIYK